MSDSYLKSTFPKEHEDAEEDFDIFKSPTKDAMN